MDIKKIVFKNLDGSLRKVNIVNSINGIDIPESGNIVLDTVKEVSLDGSSLNVLKSDGSSSSIPLAGINNPVKTVNGKSPDSNGNISIETSSVKTVDNITPDENGNVLLNVVKTINNTKPDENGNVTIEGGKVKTVDGKSPDSNGNVALNAIKSINGNVPNTSGDFELNAVSDITLSEKNLNIESANGNIKTLVLPFSDVKTVNNLQPDEQGNIEIQTGTVKTVNNIHPDESGNVTIEVPSADIDTSEFVKSVNGSTPDNTGNISIDIPSTDGMVKSVNSQIPDKNGNVDITIPEVDLSGLVKSINNIHPDESGNVSLNVFTTPGNIIKWETDFFDIAPSGLYSFDLSNTAFANIPREAINIQMVGKVKTAQNGFKVDDYVWPQFANYNGNTSSTEQGSTPYIRGNVLSIKFGNEKEFVVSTPNAAVERLDKTNVKVKLILTALIEEV